MRYTNFLVLAIAASDLSVNALPIIKERSDLVLSQDGKALDPRDPGWPNTVGQGVLALCAAGAGVASAVCGAHGETGAAIATGAVAGAAGVGIGALQIKQGNDQHREQQANQNPAPVPAPNTPAPAPHTPAPAPHTPAPAPVHPAPAPADGTHFHTLPQEPNPWANHKPIKHD